MFLCVVVDLPMAGSYKLLAADPGVKNLGVGV